MIDEIEVEVDVDDDSNDIPPFLHHLLMLCGI